jgi:hypothetical protein
MLVQDQYRLLRQEHANGQTGSCSHESFPGEQVLPVVQLAMHFFYELLEKPVDLMDMILES